MNEDTGEVRAAHVSNDDLDRKLHRLIAKVESDIDRLAFNTPIAAMIEFVNAATSADSGSGSLTRDQIGVFARVLCPFAPHLAEEIWRRAGHEAEMKSCCSLASWPIHDPAKLRDSSIEIPVSVLGKVRSRVVVPADADAKTMETAALTDAAIQKLIEGKAIKKVIVVPGKMVNIVTG